MTISISESTGGRKGRPRTLIRGGASQRARSAFNGLPTKVKKRRANGSPFEKASPPPRPQPQSQAPSGPGPGLHTAEQVWKLTTRNCRWPLGDPQHQDFRFCCDVVIDGNSYCRRHCAASVRGGSPCDHVGTPDAAAQPTRTAMTNAELRRALDLLGVSAGRLARLVGCNQRTARHWTLDRPVPPGVGILILLIASGRVSIRTVEKLTQDHTY
jgi:hypothetical protein